MEKLENRENHPANKEISEKRLLISTFLNLFITIVEVIGGLLSNSLALLSDALHNLGDTLAIFIAYVAHKVSKKSNTSRKTFGYKRVEILAALFNAALLLVIIGYLFIEAYHRLLNPEPIKGLIMFVVAVSGLLANLVAVLLLYRDSGKNINIRAAYLHLIGDTVSSVAVVLGAVLIYFFKIYWLDPLLTLLIGLYLLRMTIRIIRQTVDILLQFAPRELELEEVKRELEALEGVSHVDHMHAWCLTDRVIHFECHVGLINDLSVSRASIINQNIRNTLLNNYNISHVTLEVEYGLIKKGTIVHNCSDR